MLYSYDTLGYYNGKYDEIEKMSIPMNDRVCWFGDAVYDVTYCHNYNIYNLKEHMDRFFASAAKLNIVIPNTYEEMCDLLVDTVKKLKSGDQMIYWQVSRGTASRNHVYDKNIKGNIWIMLRPIPVKDTYTPIKAITVEDTRFFHCDIKTVNLIPNVLASQKAQELGAEEAIFHRGDTVTECAHSNVSILKDGVFITHPTDEYILAGIARSNLIKFCKQLGIAVEERAFTVEELFAADEVIVSSSGSFCIPVSHIDGKCVGGKDHYNLKRLQDTAVKDFLSATEK